MNIWPISGDFPWFPTWSLTSPCKNYFRSVGQNIRHAFNTLQNILIPCWTCFSVDDQQICQTFQKKNWSWTCPWHLAYFQGTPKTFWASSDIWSPWHLAYFQGTPKTFWASSDIWSFSSDIWLNLTAALRQTFSKFIRHVWRDWPILRSLNFEHLITLCY